MKTKIGPKNCLYPMPTVLVGVMVNGKPNYITISHIGIMDMKNISISVNQEHYSCAGIKENKAFSINIPTEKMVEKADYCGLVSGDRTDKAKLFETFYSEKLNVPMIKECPANMECRLVKTLNFPDHDIYIAEIIETYCNEEYVKDGEVGIEKINPILFILNSRSYFKLGEKVADAWSIGEKLI